MIESIIVGIVQGIAEWLPISSEGLVSLIMLRFGYELEYAVYYALWLHMGTMLAALIYFRKDIPVILKDYRPHKRSILWFIFLATLCSILVGAPVLFFSLDRINLAWASAFIGIMLIFTGIFQLASPVRGQKGRKLHLGDSVLVGLLQGFSAMPGISRSGITTATFLMRKYTPSVAFRLSFLMSIPLVMISSAYLILNTTIAFSLESLVALACSFVFGLLSIHLLLKFAQKVNFSAVCIVLGVIGIIATFV